MKTIDPHARANASIKEKKDRTREKKKKYYQQIIIVTENSLENSSFDKDIRSIFKEITRKPCMLLIWKKK
jgi:hypothetical protein